MFLVILLTENDWVHAVRQLIMENKYPALGIENERLALDLLSEGMHVRMISKAALVEATPGHVFLTQKK